MRKYEITTPEQVRFHYEIAGMASRAMAWTVDQILLMIVRMGMFFAFGGFGETLGVVLVLLGFFILDFGYFIFFELYWAGQSPGKRAFGLRVISARGGRLEFPDVFIRNLLRPVDTLPFAMFLGGVVSFIDSIHRRVGDFVAETIVIRDARVSLPSSMLKRQTRINTFEADPAIRNRILARVSRAERDLMLDLMLRRDELDETVREELFSQAAAHFRKRYSLPEDLEYLSDEQTVLNLALVVLGATFT